MNFIITLLLLFGPSPPVQSNWAMFSTPEQQGFPPHSSWMKSIPNTSKEDVRKQLPNDEIRIEKKPVPLYWFYWFIPERPTI